MHGRRSWLVCAGLACAVGAAHANDVAGAWLSPAADNWPLIPIHASLTPDGRVLTFGTKGDGQQTGLFIYDVWDPAEGLDGGHITLPNYTQVDTFCSFQLLLPGSGKIVLFGGDTWDGTGTTNVGNNLSSIYDYRDSTLTRGNDMVRRRWYASATTLMNGEVYVQGGNAEGTSQSGNGYSEIRDLNGKFRRLDNVRPSQQGLYYYYPRNFVAPDGHVFGLDKRGSLYFVTTAGTGSLTIVGSIGESLVGTPATTTMFQPGRILVVSSNNNQAHIIDINGPVPTVTRTGNLSARRAWSNATILPDGRVLVTGGSGEPNRLVNVTYHAEIWDPATGTWKSGASGARPRMYHSMALLLPDASVLVGGGGAAGDAPIENLHSELYYPPYFYDESGGLAPRPVLDTAPGTLVPGQNFSLTVAEGDIARVTLLRAGAVTHSVNLAQNFVELPFTQSEGTLFVDMHDRATDIPPGYYLLFLINHAGTPSVGRMVRIDVQSGGGSGGGGGGSGGSDNQAPTTPGNLSITKTNGNPKLSWSASSDAVGVQGYWIRRSSNGTLGPQFAQTTGLTWTDTTVVEGTTYTYAVQAYDAAGNLSANTPLKSITAFQKPTKPGNFNVALSNLKPGLTFTASTDNVAVVGYNVYRSTNGTLGPLYAQIAGSPWVDAIAQSGVNYTYAVRARDAAGYLSGATSLKTITSK